MALLRLRQCRGRQIKSCHPCLARVEQVVDEDRLGAANIDDRGLVLRESFRDGSQRDRSRRLELADLVGRLRPINLFPVRRWIHDVACGGGRHDVSINEKDVTIA